MPKRKGRPPGVLAPAMVSGKRLNAKGDIYGIEGTNKTLPLPMDDAVASSDLQGVKSSYIPKSPYVRG